MKSHPLPALILLAMLFILPGFTFKEPVKETAPKQEEKKKTEIPAKMQWFQDAKLGIFIHWGIYAVNGTAESWAFFRN